MKIFWQILALVVFPLFAQADETVPPTVEAANSVKMTTFRAYQISIIQSAGKSYSGGLSWTSSWKINDRWNFCGVLGASALKGFSIPLFIIDLELLLDYQSTGPWEFNAGPGLQTWIGTGGGTGLTGNLETSYRLNETWHLFFGYTLLFASANSTHEIKLGLGVTL